MCSLRTDLYLRRGRRAALAIEEFDHGHLFFGQVSQKVFEDLGHLHEALRPLARLLRRHARLMGIRRLSPARRVAALMSSSVLLESSSAGSSLLNSSPGGTGGGQQAKSSQDAAQHVRGFALEKASTSESCRFILPPSEPPSARVCSASIRFCCSGLYNRGTGQWVSRSVEPWPRPKAFSAGAVCPSPLNCYTTHALLARHRAVATGDQSGWPARPPWRPDRSSSVTSGDSARA